MYRLTVRMETSICVADAANWGNIELAGTNPTWHIQSHNLAATLYVMVYNRTRSIDGICEQPVAFLKPNWLSVVAKKVPNRSSTRCSNTLDITQLIDIPRKSYFTSSRIRASKSNSQSQLINKSTIRWTQIIICNVQRVRTRITPSANSDHHLVTECRKTHFLSFLQCLPHDW